MYIPDGVQATCAAACSADAISSSCTPSYDLLLFTRMRHALVWKAMMDRILYVYPMHLLGRKSSLQTLAEPGSAVKLIPCN